MGRLARVLLLVVVGGSVNVLLFADGLHYVLPARAPAPATDGETHPRAVVLGFDGMDPRWLARYLEEDAKRPVSQRRLPHFARLAKEGAFRRLESEIPPESPVAWASVLTGVNPARHHVFDFVRPGPDYRPVNGMVSVRRMRVALGRVPIRPPQVASRLAAPTFLERVHDAGYPVLSLRQPLLFPVPDRPGSRMLSGLGTPDLAGGAGFYAIYSSRAGFPSGDTVFGGVQIPLDPDETTTFDTYLLGPPDPTLPRGARGEVRRARTPLRFEVLDTGPRPSVAIHLAGRTEIVELGARSPFMLVPFELGTVPAIRVRGHVRFEVKRTSPLVVLADPVNIYAPTSPLPLTTPRAYANWLFDRYGRFETVGWTEQTFALNDGYQDDEGFLRDLLEDMDRGAGILMGEIVRGGKCVFQVFTATDRGLHCFYRYYDPLSPSYVPGRVEALGEPMLTLYARADRIVGDVLGVLEPGDLLLICSDHGFATWRWEVNLNRWLLDHGYLALSGDVVEQNLAQFFQDGDVGADAVDWSRTRAYAMGLGQIYLNLKGREEEGIVDPADAPALAREIREKLLATRNPYRPADVPIRQVYLLHELYRGDALALAAELQVGFEAAYRVSWQTALLGGMGEPVFTENRLPWSGDHCSSDVRVVPGILVMNRKVPEAPPDRPYHVRDVAATVEAFFGLDTSSLDGRPIPFEKVP